MLNRSKICLASIYARNILNINFFDTMNSTLLAFSDAILILGEDFNLLVHPVIDSTNPVSDSPACIKAVLKDLNGVDIWRLLNPFMKD